MPNNDQTPDIDRTMDEIRDALTWTEERKEVNELKALQLLLDLTRRFHTIHDVHRLVEVILDSAIAFADADRAFLMMINEDGTLRFKMGRDHDRRFLPQEEFTPSTSVIEKTLERGSTVIVPDTLADVDLSKRSSIQEMGIRTIMCSLLTAKNNHIGLLYVDSQHPMGFYSSAHVNVIASLADQAAVAISNATKFETHS